jgi:hypothetical protein
MMNKNTQMPARARIASTMPNVSMTEAPDKISLAKMICACRHHRQAIIEGCRSQVCGWRAENRPARSVHRHSALYLAE